MAANTRGLSVDARRTGFAKTVNCSGQSIVLIVLAACLACMPAKAADDPFAYHELVMYRRPTVQYPKTIDRFADGLAELWIRSLQQPDPEIRRLVVDTIAHAHRRGVANLESAQQELISLAEDPTQRLDVARGAARALIVMDARDQAELLAGLATKHGSAVAEIVEPALTNWESPVFKDVWLERVTERVANPSLMTMAMQGLAALQAEDAVEPLKTILSSVGETTQMRMEAARALAAIDRSGLVQLAGGLLEESPRHPGLNAVMAIELLAQHDGDDAVAFLSELVDHQITAVQSRAMQRLYEIDFRLVDRHALTLVSSPDANIRRWCALAMIDSQDVDRIKPIASLLNDVNPSLRRHVADALIKLADDDALHDEVLAQTMEVLNQNQWRGCEQACVVLAKLDHKPSGERMVELLGHERGEVQVASAWGLTQLRIEKLLPDMLEHAQSIYDGFNSGQLNDTMPGASLHVGHLFIAFGDQLYGDAEPLLRKYIPKDFTLGTESRAAACWAIGMLYENNPDNDLVRQLTARLNDTGFEGEDEETREMCAVSLGRMNAESSLESLRTHAGNDGSGRRCYWAIEQITGEPSPPPKDSVRLIDEWFMAPLSKRNE